MGSFKKTFHSGGGHGSSSGSLISSSSSSNNNNNNHNNNSSRSSPNKALRSSVAPPRQQESSSGSRMGRKKIMFDMGANKVHFIRVPPRSRNKEFWFTETQRIVKKGLQFEVEPEINTAINVDCRVQLSTIAMSALSASPSSPPSPRTQRGVISVLDEEGNMFEMIQMASAPHAPTTPPKQQWLAVGSVRPGEMTSVKVILPRGVYQIRCEGTQPIQVFGQAWDIERELR